ncbi:MAG: pyridine nucleotide-disulfide oxidoreductase/dicluster-binding protein [Oscillospiraceae bacterium]
MNNEYCGKALNMDKCFRGEPAFCSCKCPFGIDVRDFMGRLQRGNFDAAYKLYRNAVIFPGVVSQICERPCEGACIMAEHGGNLNISALEMASMHFARSLDPIRFNVPKKNGRIAVIGAGISGMTCALKLASRKYDVEIFEKSGGVGGSLRGIVPDDTLQDDIMRQFKFEHYALNLYTEVDGIDNLGFDAYYIATGGGDGLGFLKNGEVGLQIAGKNIVLGGRLTGSTHIGAILDGIAAAQALEGYIKTGNLVLPEKKVTNETAMRREAIAVNDLPAVVASDGGYTKEEAEREAARCLRCDCSACFEVCDFMRQYKRYPKHIADEMVVAFGDFSWAPKSSNRMVNSCSSCGLCKAVCKAGVNTGEMLLEARRRMHKRGMIPPGYHEFWLRDMEFSNTEAFVVSKPSGAVKCEYLFFPGCSLGASDPRYVTEVYEYLLTQNAKIAVMTACCGAPAVWAGDMAKFDKAKELITGYWEKMGRPVFILACPSCKKMFDENLPEVGTLSLYEYLRDKKLSVTPQIISSACVFDPCASREYPGMQESVRKALKNAGITIHELPMHGEKAECCSFGGNIVGAAPMLAEEMAKNRVSQSDEPYITYCTNCRDIFATQGKTALHVLDVLFGLGSGNRRVPTVTERQYNRITVKNAFIKGGSKMTDDRKLIISEELRKRISREWILETDILDVIIYCEKTCKKLRDTESGVFIGYKVIGNMTYWVSYIPRGNSYEVINAYGHRMMIEE